MAYSRLYGNEFGAVRRGRGLTTCPGRGQNGGTQSEAPSSTPKAKHEIKVCTKMDSAVPWESVWTQWAWQRETGEMREVPEEPQGQDTRAVLGRGAGGGKAGCNAVRGRATYNMNAAELEIDWPLFPLALLASSSPGAGGEAEPPV